MKLIFKNLKWKWLGSDYHKPGSKVSWPIPYFSASLKGYISMLKKIF